jgi:hypothetical protein
LKREAASTPWPPLQRFQPPQTHEP